MNWDTPQILELAVTLVMVISLALGLWRGLLREVLSLLGWVLAFYLAQAHAVTVGQWLPWTVPTRVCVWPVLLCW